MAREPCACGAEAKYRCPACQTPSCSLPCVKKHKAERQCSGQRDDSAFCDIRSFDDRVLLRDYQLLEGISRTIDASERGREQLVAKQGARGGTDGLSPARRELLRQAQWRGVGLELLPHGMQRQRENTSRYDHRRKRLAWRVEFHFAQVAIRHACAQVSEGCTLLTLLRSLLEPDFVDLEPVVSSEALDGAPSSSEPPARLFPATSNAAQRKSDGRRALLQHKLRRYTRVGAAGLMVFLRAEGRCANDPRFYLLTLHESLSTLLAGKRVIEFPTLHVATPDEAHSYPLLEAAPSASNQ
ncbi:hypothetical protein AB1Y20_015363 [Prymnesium parvum]|uniref:HIT-type domain-containing protein n=1 Tax=Prymnesium parvum TaxID=97485 RepID=A0AB34K2C1_PRYPA